MSWGESKIAVRLLKALVVIMLVILVIVLIGTVGQIITSRRAIHQVYSTAFPPSRFYTDIEMSKLSKTHGLSVDRADFSMKTKLLALNLVVISENKSTDPIYFGCITNTSGSNPIFIQDSSFLDLALDRSAVSYSKNGVIYIYYPGNGAIAKIGNEYWHTWPTLSNSGKSIAFAETKTPPGPGHEIRVMTLDYGQTTGNMDRLGNKHHRISNLVWSPSDDKLAYLGIYRSTLGDVMPKDIYVLDIKTWKTERITTTKDVRDIAPSWSADGSRIAFVSKGPKIEVEDIDSRRRTVLLDLTDRTKQDHSSAVYSVEWSADGKHILFAYESWADDKTAIGIISLDSGKTTWLSRDVNCFVPRWADSGNEIIYTKYVDHIHPEIWKCRLDGTHDQRLFKIESLKGRVINESAK